MCRHTVGLNYVAIGIEHVGTSDAEILDDAAQMRSSLALTAWLMSRYGIALKNVIGHNESLTSPFHKELYAPWRHQTHADWRRADMNVYRGRLAALLMTAVGTVRAADEPDAARVVTLVAVVVPPLGLVLAMGFLWGLEFHWIDLALFAGLYVLCAFGTTIGFHRYFTHKGFEARAPVKALLAILGCMTMQGPVTQWVTDHRKHHALSDQPGDPHSPHVGHGDGALGRAARLRACARRLDVLEPRHGAGARVRPRSLRRQTRAHDRPPLSPSGSLLTLGIPFAIGYAVGGTWGAGVEGLVWGGLIRIAAYQHATFSVNSICHMFGRQDYRSRDEARNNWIVALLVFGEGWHNNHHAFPVSARHGLAPLAARRLVVGDSRARAARARLERARSRTTAQLQRRRGSDRLKARQLVRDGRAHASARGSGTGAPQCARSAIAVQRAADHRVARPRRRARARGRSRGASSPATTPGIPGSQRSSEPCSTSRRLPRERRRASSRSGIHGASPTTRLDRRLVRRPRSRPRRPSRSRAAASARRRPRRSRRARPRRTSRAGFHDLIR